MIEIHYGFDEIEIDDNYFPIDGVTQRDTTFVNQKSIRSLSGIKSGYIDQERQNNPVLIFVLGFNNNGKSYER